MAIGLSSCGNKEQCYEITVTVTVSVPGVSVPPQTSTSYVWTTESEVNAATEQAKQEAQAAMGGYGTASVTYKKSSKSEKDCH